MKTYSKNFFFTVLLLISLHFGFAQTRTIDSLKNLLKIAKEDTSKVIILNDLAYEYKSDQPSIAYNYVKQSKELAQKIDYPAGVVYSMYLLGAVYYYKGDYEQAMSAYEESIKIAASLNDYVMLANNHNNIARIYAKKGEMKKSLEFNLKSLEFAKKAEDKLGIAIALSALGGTYRNLASYSNDKKYYNLAIENYLQGKKLYLEIGNFYGVASATGNIAFVYMDQKKYNDAIRQLYETKSIFEKLNDKGSISHSLMGIAGCYGEKGELGKSEELYTQALNISKELEDKSGMAEILLNMGELHSLQGRYDDAVDAVGKCLVIASELGEKDKVMKCYEIMAKLNYKRKNYQEAYDYYELFNQFKDTLISDQTSKQIIEMQTKYETDKKESEIELLTKGKEIQNVELARQTTQRNGFIAGFVLMLALAGVSYHNYRNKRKAHAEIALQKAIVDEKNKDILDSINYAKRIQQALLKEEEHVSAHLPEHFILFKPKDIVSGDFYWSMEKHGHLYLAAVDCTGHGVPGAFMSMLGIAFLNEITALERLLTPAEVLDRLREKIIKELSQTGKEGESKDGMDISLVRLNLSSNELQWSGANNPLWIIKTSSDDISEIKPDKQPIGFHPQSKPFTLHTIQLQKQDTVYLFTDGYADQFGGEKDKKFTYKRKKKLLHSIQNKTMQEQKDILLESLEAWKGKYEQIDDVCVIGMRI